MLLAAAWDFSVDSLTCPKMSLYGKVLAVGVSWQLLYIKAYQFRVVDASDPDAQRVNLVPRPDVVIEKRGKTSIDVTTTDHTDRPKDVYAELLKLDDLRKRGILSEAKFDAQKKKLLSGH